MTSTKNANKAIQKHEFTETDSSIIVDGSFEVSKEKIRMTLACSNVSPLAQAVIEQATGQSIEKIVAGNMKEKHDAEIVAIAEQERLKAETERAFLQANVKHVRQMFADGSMLIFKGNEVLQDIPKEFTDEELEKIFYNMKRFTTRQTNFDWIQSAIQYTGCPGFRVIMINC